jgi:hypothetical protein
VGAAIFSVVEFTAMIALWMPLFPMAFAAMVGQCFVLAAVVEYSESVARNGSARRPRPHIK